MKKSIYILCLIFFNIVVLASDVEVINPVELYQSIKNKTFKDIILDVRSPFEQKESGIIKGATIKNIYDQDFVEYIKTLDKSKSYIVYCHSGVRSKKAVELMKKYKINGYNLVGGIVKWKKLSFPLGKDDSKKNLLIK